MHAIGSSAVHHVVGSINPEGEDDADEDDEYDGEDDADDEGLRPLTQRRLGSCEFDLGECLFMRIILPLIPKKKFPGLGEKSQNPKRKEEDSREKQNGL